MTPPPRGLRHNIFSVFRFSSLGSGKKRGLLSIACRHILGIHIILFPRGAEYTAVITVLGAHLRLECLNVELLLLAPLLYPANILTRRRFMLLTLLIELPKLLILSGVHLVVLITGLPIESDVIKSVNLTLRGKAASTSLSSAAATSTTSKHGT